MNTAKVEYYDKKHNMGIIIINDTVRASLSREVVGYGEKTFNALMGYVVTGICFDFNMSDRLTFHAKTLKGIISQIEKAQHKIVKYRP